MKRYIKASAWDTPVYDRVVDQYLPSSGEGNNMAEQCVTAVNKLVYKWYNDGDVFDNTHYLAGWANDLSDYANWLYKYIPDSQDILDSVFECHTDSQYEKLLEELIHACFDAEDLENLAKQPKRGSIYDCDGPYEFDEDREDYEGEDEDY